MKLGKVLLDYDFPTSEGERPCGIASCSTPHRRGYVIELTLGRLSHVGRDCGKRLFGVDWTKQLHAYREVRSQRAKVQAVLDARSTARDAIQAGRAFQFPGLERVRALFAAFDELPAPVRDSIFARAQSNDSAVYTWRKPTDREIRLAHELKKPYPPNVRVEHGRIDALGFVRDANRATRLHDSVLSGAIAALEQLLLDQAADARVLTEGVRAISDARDGVEKAVNGALRFFQPANLAYLSFLPAMLKNGFTSVVLDESGRLTITRA